VRDPEFERVARAALPRASEWLPDVLPGKQRGIEWVGLSTSHGGPGDSWSFNLETGLWKHFAGHESGNDSIGFVAAVFRLSMGAAKEWLDRRLGLFTSDPAPQLPRLPESVPAPESDPDQELIPEQCDEPGWGRAGVPEAIYRYGRDYWVSRHQSEGNPKRFLQWTWREGRWCPKGPKAPTRLYRAEQLALHPDATVLLVEGEKCVEVAAPVLNAFLVLTWSGGAAGARKANWEVLRGRRVVIWPDNDEPGRKAAAIIAARLSSIATEIRVARPDSSQPDGWDVADAIRDGWEKQQLVDWLKSQLGPPVEKTTSSSPTELTSSDRTAEASLEPQQRRSHLVSLAALDLERNERGVPYPTVANCSEILRNYADFAGRIWFDDFRGAIYHTFRGAVAQRWTDSETRALTVAIQKQLKLEKFNTHLILEALQHAAECNRRNSLVAWLDSLSWDGVERLDSWLQDCLGVELSEYTLAVSRNWPIAMVARAYRPGCKMDTMPVLEGISGLRKSQFLSILGGEWYKALSMQFGEKDFLQAMRGAWLIEIPDMAGFNRAEHGKVIAVLSTAVDTYRVPYGREPEDVPRTCVFAATSEDDDYLSDMRGKRRYWPLRCTDINLDTLRQQRAQIFAEAIVRYRAGNSWYEMPTSAAEEQLDRAIGDEWSDVVLEKAEELWIRYAASPVGSAITAKKILVDCLGFDIIDVTEVQCRRVSAILRRAGWRRKRRKYGFMWIKTG
jgi:putative DNA primase/helicase